MSFQTTEIPKSFLAYPSKPDRIGEILRTFSEDLNKTSIAEVLPWQNLVVSGRIIISQICAAIEESDVFICDLTYLNANVLFELGYAIAHRKKIWPLMDTSIENSVRNFKELNLLSAVGYHPYKSASDVLNGYYETEPASQEKVLYDQLLEFSTPHTLDKDSTLFYLKASHPTESSTRITRAVTKSALSQVVDNPREVKNQPFSWYAQKITEAFAVISHFESVERTGAVTHNAKQSLISGIAYGLKKKLLMVADAPFEPPIDYKHLLFTGDTAKQCEGHVDIWLKSTDQEFLNNKQRWKEFQQRQEAKQGLTGISIGDPIAENESLSLIDYFVPTAAYTEALNSQRSIFIGRKGTGKSANLIKLAYELEMDRRNHVCIIKPEDYDLDGLVNVLQNNAERAISGYMIQSMWKFLLYSELLKSLHEELEQMPSHYAFTTAEEDLKNFFVDNQDIVAHDFATRLDILVDVVSKPTEGGDKDKKLRLSEVLHEKLLGPMAQLLASLLKRKERVMLLVDNLDASWRAEPTPELANLLWGLLSVTQQITLDINKHRPRGERRQIKLSAVLFLRSDIFHRLLSHAREKDKVSYSKLLWNDGSKLMHVIEERLKSSIGNLTPPQIWETYFPKTIDGVSLDEYAASNILPRPRDIIFLFRAAISEAVGRGHASVLAEDFKSAKKHYGEHALNSIFTEYVDGEFELQEICYRLMGGPPSHRISELKPHLTSAGVPGDRHDACIKKLLELSLLGFEVSNNKFRYNYDYESLRMLEVMANRYATDTNSELRVSIHPAFHTYLEIFPATSQVSKA